MSPILTNVLGPAGALAGALLLLAALATGRYFVPKWVYESSEARNTLLETESAALNESVKQQTLQNTLLREEMAGLRVEVSHLREEVATLRGGQRG